MKEDETTEFALVLKDMAPAGQLRKLDYCNTHSGHALSGLIEALVMHDKLEELDLTDSCRPLPFGGILPLSHLTSLQHLRVNVDGWDNRMTDEDMGTLVGRMTRLRSLMLYGNVPGPSGPRPHISLLALSIITAACPNIEFISLRIDASEHLIPRTHPSRHHNLRSVNLTGSRIDAPEAATAYLARLSDRADFVLHCSYVFPSRGLEEVVEVGEAVIWREVIRRPDSARSLRSMAR